MTKKHNLHDHYAKKLEYNFKYIIAKNITLLCQLVHFFISNTIKKGSNIGCDEESYLGTLIVNKFESPKFSTC